MKVLGALVASLAFAASRCGGPQPPPPPPPPPPDAGTQVAVDPLRMLSERLRDPSWAQQLDPFKDTSPVPQAGGLEYMPEQALGHVWAVSIKKNLDASKTCMNIGVGPNATTDTEIVPLGRFLVTDSKKCRVKPVGEQKVYEFRVEAGATAKTAIGPFLDGSGQADRAFEVLITHPTHVTVEPPALVEIETRVTTESTSVESNNASTE